MSIRTDKPSSEHDLSVESFICLYGEGRKRSGLTDEMGDMAQYAGPALITARTEYKGGG